MQDPTTIADANYKRLYCVEAKFCNALTSSTCDGTHVDATLTSIQCVTGLAFDGSPADVVPSLEDEWGVVFSWLDTSTVEFGFRIFRGTEAMLSNGDWGAMIADVRVDEGSLGGRIFIG